MAADGLWLGVSNLSIYCCCSFGGDKKLHSIISASSAVHNVLYWALLINRPCSTSSIFIAGIQFAANKNYVGIPLLYRRQ